MHIKAYDGQKNLSAGITYTPDEELEEVEGGEDEVPEVVTIEQEDIFKKKENGIKLEIEPIIAPPAPPKVKKKRTKRNKNYGRPCTEKQLKHMANMRAKASAALRKKAADRKMKEEKDEHRKKDVEKTIRILSKKATKVKRTKAEKQQDFFEMMDAYVLARKPKPKPKPKPQPKPQPKKVQFAPSVPHPNRRVPTRFRPVPPPQVPGGQFSHLFGTKFQRKPSSRGWRG